MINLLLIVLIGILLYIATIFTSLLIENKKDKKQKQKNKLFFEDQWNKIYNVLIKKKKLYNVESKYILAPKCNNCNDNRKVKVTLPDKTEKWIDCSCNKYKTEYYINDLTKEINFIICKDGSVAVGLTDGFDIQYIIVSLEEAKQKFQKQKYFNYFNKYCFTSKKEAEQFKDWYIENFKK